MLAYKHFLKFSLFLVMGSFVRIASADIIQTWNATDGAITINDDDQWLSIQTQVVGGEKLLSVVWYLLPKNTLEQCRFGLNESPQDSAMVIAGEVIGVSVSCIRQSDQTFYTIYPKSLLYMARVVDVFKRKTGVKIESNIVSFTASAIGFSSVWNLKVAEYKFQMPPVLDMLAGTRILASRGSVVDQLTLGYCYTQSDMGCDVDYKVAFKWNEMAALQGDPSGQMALGIAYANGLGVEQNFSKAAGMFKKSATQGLRASQFYLSQLYWHGDGVIKDPVSAHMWNNISAGNGYDKAINLRPAYDEALTQQQLDEAYVKARRCVATGYTEC